MLKRLRVLDRVLVLTLFPLWVACFSLGIRTQIQGGGALPGFGVSLENETSYPRVTGEFSALYVESPLDRAGLREGDVLLRLGEADLRGVGPLGLRALAREEARGALTVPLVYERGSERRRTALSLFPMSIFQPWLAASLAFAASGLLLLLRAEPTPVVSTYFHGSLCFAFFLCFFAGSELEFYACCAVLVTAWTFAFPLLFRFMLRFPDGRAPSGRWHQIWPWAFTFVGPSAALALMGPVRLGEFGFNGGVLLAAVGLLAVATSKYRRGNAVARRQVRWALFGLYCFLLPPTLASSIAAVDESLGWLLFVSVWAAPLFPLCLLVSVARFNLFDVDRLLSAAASYNILLVLLVGGGLVVVPRAGQAAIDLVGVDSTLGEVAMALVLAAVLIPAHRRLRPQIDRIFFRERYEVERGIGELIRELSRCGDPRSLTELAGARLYELLEPESCVIYARAGRSYAAVFAVGRAVPPAFEAESPLIGTLRGRSEPLALSDAGRRPDATALGPFDRAALETLQAEVMVPTCSEDELLGFLCLGPKRSGDVYTSTDLSHLYAIAQTVSNQLLRFDQEEGALASRAMEHELRRYVPAAVARQLGSGGDLEARERAVSVLFVDIRGYTAYSENRRAQEVFSTVNHYTMAVSSIVERSGGSVVEFSGDGLMAVFGAPTPLPDKERAAVSAAREILSAVKSIPHDSAGEELSVGIGVATGSAFVGNVQSVDRLIWTALGNTTNLAARLQALTRELDAAVVIDLVTWRSSGDAARDFVLEEQVAIRGRSRPEDVYALRAR